MGIPTYFRSLLKNHHNDILFKNIDTIDHVFIDFNSLIYKSFQDCQKKNQTVEESFIIDECIHRINDIIKKVKPQKTFYISIDGTAPFAKIIQQRSRRYKSVILNEMIQKKKMEYNIEFNKNNFDPSCNICPGTIFMYKLESKIIKFIKLNNWNFNFYLDGSNHPGEGEHKFLNRIRKISNNESIIIFSPDGDLLSLSLLLQKNNIWIMRIPDPKSLWEKPFSDTNDYLFVSIDKLKEYFLNEFSIMDSNTFINDYNILLMMVGNDFICSLSFLKIRSGGLDLLLNIYKRIIKPNYSLSFIENNNICINYSFFLELMKELSIIEEYEMKKEWKKIYKEYNGLNDHFRLLSEKEMSKIELYESRLQHLSFFNHDNPLFNEYGNEWKNIDMNSNDWKNQFNQYFFNTSNNLDDIIKNYIESLLFTISYYTKKCPSYTWYYKYRNAPLPSDIVLFLEKNPNIFKSLSFQNDSPYTPFEQLLFILPAQQYHILPTIFKDDIIKYNNINIYNLKLDVLAGLKFIYSEIIFPDNINYYDILFIQKIYNHHSLSLNNQEKFRNRINHRIWLKPVKLL